MEQQAKIKIDEKEYVIEDLSERAKYCVAQIQDLQKQASQLEMANNGFLQALKDEIVKEK